MEGKDTEKYRKGYRLAVKVEKEVEVGRMSEEELAAMGAEELYAWLWNEWWIEWNGVIQDWERYRLT